MDNIINFLKKHRDYGLFFTKEGSSYIAKDNMAITPIFMCNTDLDRLNTRLSYDEKYVEDNLKAFEKQWYRPDGSRK